MNKNYAFVNAHNQVVMCRPAPSNVLVEVIAADHVEYGRLIELTDDQAHAVQAAMQLGTVTLSDAGDITHG